MSILIVAGEPCTEVGNINTQDGKAPEHIHKNFSFIGLNRRKCLHNSSWLKADRWDHPVMEEGARPAVLHGVGKDSRLPGGTISKETNFKADCKAKD